MKRIIRITNRFYLGMVFMAALVLGSFAAHKAYSDFWNTGQLFEGSVTSSVHTPVVATVTGSTAAVSNSLFTSGTSSVSFDSASSITTAFDLLAVRVTLSAASSTQTLVLSVDSGAGTEFDVTLLSEATSNASVIFRPTRPVTFRAADALDIVYANANSVTIGIEIIYTTPGS